MSGFHKSGHIYSIGCMHHSSSKLFSNVSKANKRNNIYKDGLNITAAVL